MDNLKKLIRDLGYVKMGLISAFVILFILIIVFFTANSSSSSMSVLYSNLSSQDAAKIIEDLEKKKINYEIVGDGSIIKVPNHLVLKTRINLSKLGIPNNGSFVGFEIFDKEEGLGTTGFLQNVKMLRAMEGEIARTIKSFDQVEDARVHLVIPQRELFSKEKEEPKASVVLKIFGNKNLSKSEIDSIAHLVSSAVTGLDIKNVNIVDTKGKSLKLASEEDSNYATSSQEDYRISYENRLKKSVEDLLEKSLGQGKVKVHVVADIDFDRSVINSETFDPDGQVIRSTQSVEEKERTPSGSGSDDDISIANNLPDFGNPEGQGDKVSAIDKTDEVVNYEISKTIKNQVVSSNIVKKLSIAVLVDDSYDRGESKYAPRSIQELEKIENLVKASIGYSKDREDFVQITNMSFAENFYDNLEKEENMGIINPQLLTLVQNFVMLVFCALLFIFVIKPIAIRAFETKKPPIDYERRDFPKDENKIMESSMTSFSSNIDFEKDISSKNRENSKRINDIILNNPEESLSIIRKWLHK